MKELLEKRNDLQNEMESILNSAKEETRALTEEESAKFDSLEAEIKAIDKTIEAEKRATDLAVEEQPQEEKQMEEVRSTEETEVRAFDEFLRGGELRADWDKGTNGAVIPKTIANKIIQKVIEICPIYADADRYNVKGTLDIPYYDETTQAITVAYATEFSSLSASAGEVKSISLTGYLAGALCDVSKSLINNSQFDIVNFVINRMAISLAKFIEGELLNGTSGKIEGLKTGATNVATETAATLTLDDMLDLQQAMPDAYQTGAYFIMNKATRTALMKMKDNMGRYQLNVDPASRFGYTLFGKDVYVSDNMPADVATGNVIAFYVNPKGLAVKTSEEVNIEVLRETKAVQHVVEVVGFVELDAKVQNGQQCYKLTVA